MGILPTCMCVYHLHAWCPQSTEEAVRPLELELQMVVSCHMNAGNGILVCGRAATALTAEYCTWPLLYRFMVFRTLGDLKL